MGDATEEAHDDATLHTAAKPMKSTHSTHACDSDVEKKEKAPLEYPESIFAATWEKWLLTTVVALASCVSTVSIPIYFPILDQLAASFNVPVSKINLTATVYSIFQGVSPILWGALSDVWGRRPVYFWCIAIYIGANIGLARAQTYGTLLGLRILQAFGGASTVSLIGGTIGDFSTRRTRGSLVGMAMGISQMGNCFGPVIGGGIESQFGNWRSIFWALVIFGGMMFVMVFFCLPETNRQIVGNGSRAPLRSWRFVMSRSVYARVRHHAVGVPLYPSDSGFDELWILPPRRVQWFRWIELIVQPRVLMALVPTAIHYTTWYMVLTAQSTVLAQNYHFGTRKIGFTYLSSGIGTLACSFASGRLMQHSFKKQSRHTPMNIYKARLGYNFYATALIVVSTLIFGWTLHFQESYFVPVVMTCFVSVGATYFLNTSSALLVDLFPADSAAGQSCNNLLRCCMCAGGLAALQSMMDNMTIGGTFSFLAGLCALSAVSTWALIVYYDPRRSQERSIADSEPK